MALIEERLSYPWRMNELATAVALSRSQLTRLSHRHLGATPLQMQAELRVTEFTRLIEETELTITEAARRVGWNDPRVATIRFQRRYGVTPPTTGREADGPEAPLMGQTMGHRVRFCGYREVRERR